LYFTGCLTGFALGQSTQDHKGLLFPQHNLIRRRHARQRPQQLDVFSYVSPEQRVPQDHPLRSLRAMTDEALRELQPRFNKLYANTGRPSIAPEKLLRALLLQALYSVCSERMLMEQLNYNLLFRSFVGLNMDDCVWDVTVFTKNRERLLDGDIAEAFFQAVLQQARKGGLLSDEHFTVDGTLLEAWASVKSFQRKGWQAGDSAG
jgi:transposase